MADCFGSRVMITRPLHGAMMTPEQFQDADLRVVQCGEIVAEDAQITAEKNSMYRLL